MGWREISNTIDKIANILMIVWLLIMGLLGWVLYQARREEIEPKKKKTKKTKGDKK